MLYKHEARRPDKAITDAMGIHVDDEKPKEAS
jgi:hypothetical protein